MHNTNLVSSYNALRAAVEVGMTRICQASSVNAVGHAFSRRARYDYFPLNEAHPSYAEDPYSRSKYVCEAQADALVRRYDAEGVAVASLLFHWVVPDRAAAAAGYAATPADVPRMLACYTRLDAAARACLLALTAPSPGTRPSSSPPRTRPWTRRRSTWPGPTSLRFPSAVTCPAPVASSTRPRPSGCWAGHTPLEPLVLRGGRADGADELARDAGRRLPRRLDNYFPYSIEIAPT